ncbi:MAG: hypothetical protein JSW10_00125, partial [Pseudomonadota bacterium]
MKPGFSPLYLLVLAIATTVLVALVQLGVINVVLDKLGLSPSGALLLMLGFLGGSLINIPLWNLAPSLANAQDGAWRGS